MRHIDLLSYEEQELEYLISRLEKKRLELWRLENKIKIMEEEVIKLKDKLK